MLEGSTKGKRAWAMVHALEAQSFKRFEAAITGNPQKASMIQKGLHGLRRNGVKHTGAMTLTYLRDRVNERVTLPNIRRNRVNVKNDDLIFAMTILQHQMEAMEAKIDALLERTSNSDD